MHPALAAACLASTLVVGLPANADGPESVAIIPRDVLFGNPDRTGVQLSPDGFGNPDRTGVQLSPDGSRISWIAPVEGVLNVWVAPVGDLAAAKPVTADADRGIRQYFWMPSGTHLVYLQDRGGDENWRAYSVNLDSGAEIDLTPIAGVAAQVVHVSRDVPGTIAIGLNDRDPQYHDVHLVDAASGERTLLFKNEKFAEVTLDDSMKVRLVSEMMPDGSIAYSTVEGTTFKPFQTIPFEDSMSSRYLGLDRKGSNLFAVDSRGRDRSALTVTDLGTGKTTVIFEGGKADVAGALTDPITSEIEAVSVNYLKPEWTVLDAGMKKDLDFLRGLSAGEIGIASRTLDDSKWIVSFRSDDGPTTFFLYDRSVGSAKKLFSSKAALEGLPLVPMHGVEIKTRDGLVLPGYLSIPKWSDPDGDGKPAAPLPMVLMVHGGPWARDSWGFNSYHQWLANRGYAVLSPNFRGSTGFGKAFVNAGDGQWADQMHDDLIDAVEWAVANGIAERDKVAIMGGSYGGYAALAGLTFTPEVFAAGVAIVGPSNLITLLNSIPPYWAPMIEMFAKRVADHRTPEGRRKLRDMSPLTQVDEIVRPLLIGQGANDPRVKQQESDQIVKAMQAKSLPVTYVLYPDEGHGFAKPENNIAFNAVTEVFLAKHLGGRHEPIDDEIENSSAKVVSKGELDLPVAETSWEEIAVKEVVVETVTLESLEPAQQALAQQMLAQLEQMPAEMLPQVLGQLEAGVGMAPEEQRPLLFFMIGKIKEKMGQ